MPDQQFRYQTYQPHRQSVSYAKPPKRPYKGLLVLILGLVIGYYGIYSFVTHLPHRSPGDTNSTSTNPIENTAVKASPLPNAVQQKIATIISSDPNSQIGLALENVTTQQIETFGV